MSVKIPRPGRESGNNRLKSLKWEDFRVNNVDKNDVTLLASTGKENVPTNLVTEKNTHNEIPKAKYLSLQGNFSNRIGRTMFDQIFNTRAAYRIEKALYDESIVKQAHYLVQTLRETGLQNFGITVDALDQAYGALKSSNALPEML